MQATPRGPRRGRIGRSLVIGMVLAMSMFTAAPAHAQDPGDTQVEIGDSSSVECLGTIAASIQDLDGNPVEGGVLMVAGEQVVGSGSVDAACGEHAASLLVAPDGYAVAGATDAAVVVREAAATPIVFQVDEVQVLGVQLDRSDPPAATDATDGTDGTVTKRPAPTLPETGMDDPRDLLLLALVLLLAGTVMVGGFPRQQVAGRIR